MRGRWLVVVVVVAAVAVVDSESSRWINDYEARVTLRRTRRDSRPIARGARRRSHSAGGNRRLNCTKKGGDESADSVGSERPSPIDARVRLACWSRASASNTGVNTRTTRPAHRGILPQHPAATSTNRHGTTVFDLISG